MLVTILLVQFIFQNLYLYRRAKSSKYIDFKVGLYTQTKNNVNWEKIDEGFEYVKNHLTFTSASTFIASANAESELYQEMLG